MATWYVDTEGGADLSGTVTFTNGSNQVTAVGGAFTTECAAGGRIKRAADTGQSYWAVILSIESDNALTLMAAYAGTTGTGGKTTTNVGDSPTNCWISLQSAIVRSSGYTAGDTVKVDKGQFHTATANWTVGSSGSLASPIRVVLCDKADSWNEVPDEDKAVNQTQVTLTGYTFTMGTRIGWVFEGLYFYQTNVATLFSGGADRRPVTKFRYCRLVNTYASGFVYGSGGEVTIFEHCELRSNYRIHGGYSLPYLIDCFLSPYDTTGGYAFYVDSGGGTMFLENVTFGTADLHFARDFSLVNGALINVRGRNVVFHGTTEMVLGLDASTRRGDRYYGITIEDYNGVKGAYLHKSMEGRTTVISYAAASTPAGKKFTDTVLRATVAAGPGRHFPSLIAEFAVHVGTTGTYDVSAWTQPDDWVPDILGADADLWVEVAAWNAAESKYLRFDSRDKVLQNAQSDHAWGDIVVEDVVVGAVGWIIVRVWQSHTDSTDLLYVDMAPQVA